MVCLKGLSGLLPAACTSGTGAPYKTEPHLSLWQTSSSSRSVLLDPWTADYTTPQPPLPRTFMLLHAAKNCQMGFICILISVAKRRRTSALHEYIIKYQPVSPLQLSHIPFKKTICLKYTIFSITGQIWFYEKNKNKMRKTRQTCSQT